MDSASLFDAICRILASPMPRRRAFRIIAGTLASTGAALLPRRARAAVATRSMPVRDLSVSNSSVPGLVRLLRGQHDAPVSCIESASTARVDIEVPAGTVEDALNQALLQDPSYRMQEFNGRLVVFPSALGFYGSTVTAEIEDVPRQEAAGKYLENLNVQLPASRELAGTAMKGVRSAPVFNDPVSLSRTGQVVQHLVELLGSDENVSFSIERSWTGVYVLSFESVASRLVPEAAAGTCRVLSITYANQMNLGCTNGRCGASTVFSITGVVVCPGDNCNGAQITEAVVTDAGCIPGGVNTGAGCPVGAGNTVANCTDTYSLCAAAAAYPVACTETYTQSLSVDGTLAQTCKIVFMIANPKGGPCTGTVTRSCTSVHTMNQCCGPMGFCNTGQCCTAANTCTACNPATNCCLADPANVPFNKCVAGATGSVTGSTAGPPATLTVKVQDSTNGLQSITVTNQTNCTVMCGAVTAGTKNPVTCTATAILQRAASFTLNACSVGGCCISLDPAMTTLRIDAGRTTEQTFEVPSDENVITILNGEPGLDRVGIFINNRKFRNVELASGQQVSINADLAIANVSNIIRLWGTGPQGANAVVMIGNAAPANADLRPAVGFGGGVWGHVR